jgi:hypothetical protein
MTLATIYAVPAGMTVPEPWTEAMRPRLFMNSNLELDGEVAPDIAIAGLQKDHDIAVDAIST